VTTIQKSAASDRLASFLLSNGPALSSSAIEFLVSTGSTSASARKVIQRSRGKVLRLVKIRFAHNQQFLFLAKQYKTPGFWQALIESFRSTNSVYGYAVNSLLARDGAWPVPYFGIISGSPERLSKHISSSTVLKKLTEIELLELVDHPEIGPCAHVVEEAVAYPMPIGRALRSRVIAEDILLSGLKDWIRNTGFGSWNRVDVRNLRNQPKFGQFNWDFSAPTFVHPIRIPHNSQGSINGFIVGDVLLGRDIEVSDLEYFVLKADTMRSQRNTRPFLAVFVADRYSNTALRAGRSKGLLLVTTETLFGSQVASGLSQLIQVLNNAATAIGSNPALVSELFEKLDNLKGASLNVRGWLFELLAAHILKTDGWRIDFIGELRKDPQSGEIAEVDVLAVKGNDVIVLECKGYVTNDVAEHEVEKWLTRSIPRIRASLLADQSYRKKDITFHFWTTSKFSHGALTYVNQKKMEIKKYSFSWTDGEFLMKYCTKIKSEYAIRILREQYEL
jgi:Holliday junction resolvase